MGTSQTGPFESDVAADFLAELEASPSRSVTSALRNIVKTPMGQYIEVDDAGAAWAACELVALSFGRGDSAALADSVLEAVGRLKPKEKQRLLALESLPRIADDGTSELAQLWHEGGRGEAFDEMLTDLRMRLEDASSGARALPPCTDAMAAGGPSDAVNRLRVALGSG